MKRITIPKRHILQHKGDLNTKLYIVESGLLRSYSIDAQGKEHIFMFAPEDWLLTDNHPLGQPAELFIDALEETTLTAQDKSRVTDFDPIKMVKRMTVLQERVIMLMSATAIERYEHFVKTYPQIVQRVPQKMIASYLGITPEALSRAKKDRVLKK